MSKILRTLVVDIESITKRKIMSSVEFKVKSVKEVDGFLSPAYSYPNQYGNSNVSYSYDAKSLLIRGTIDGVDTSFFSPSSVIMKVNGLINYQKLDTNNGWYEEIKGESKLHRGAKMFGGIREKNFAIECKSQIVPTVNVGDVIKITFKEKGSFNGTRTIKNVKLVN